MARMQLNPAQQEKVKSLVTAATGLPLTKLGTYGFVGAATGPTGSTMGQVGQTAQGTRGPISDEGTQMTMGGGLNEVVIKKKPIASTETEELDDIVKINGKTYKMDDLVTQMKVLKSQFPDNHPVMYLIRNLQSGLGTTKFLKPDLRGDQSSSVDTLQRRTEVYGGEPKSGRYVNAASKYYTTPEGIEYSNRSGKKIGNIVERGGAEALLDSFLQQRGIKEFRDLSQDKETKKANK